MAERPSFLNRPRQGQNHPYPYYSSVYKRHVAPDPIALEESVDRYAPSDDLRNEQLQQLLVDKINNPGLLLSGTGIQNELSRQAVETLGNEVDLAFARDFDLFLQGKSKFNNTAYTNLQGVGEDGSYNFFHVPGVVPYLDNLIDKKYDYQAKLAKLCTGKLDSMRDVYMYYKYIVRQRKPGTDGKITLDPQRFLDDWDSYAFRDFRPMDSGGVPPQAINPQAYTSMPGNLTMGNEPIDPRPGVMNMLNDPTSLDPALAATDPDWKLRLSNQGLLGGGVKPDPMLMNISGGGGPSGDQKSAALKTPEGQEALRSGMREKMRNLFSPKFLGSAASVLRANEGLEDRLRDIGENPSKYAQWKDEHNDELAAEFLRHDNLEIDEDLLDDDATGLLQHLDQLRGTLEGLGKSEMDEDTARALHANTTMYQQALNQFELNQQLLNNAGDRLQGEISERVLKSLAKKREELANRPGAQEALDVLEKDLRGEEGKPFKERSKEWKRFVGHVVKGMAGVAEHAVNETVDTTVELGKPYVEEQIASLLEAVLPTESMVEGLMARMGFSGQKLVGTIANKVMSAAVNLVPGGGFVSGYAGKAAEYAAEYAYGPAKEKFKKTAIRSTAKKLTEIGGNVVSRAARVITGATTQAALDHWQDAEGSEEPGPSAPKQEPSAEEPVATPAPAPKGPPPPPALPVPGTKKSPPAGITAAPQTHSAQGAGELFNQIKQGGFKLRPKGDTAAPALAAPPAPTNDLMSALTGAFAKRRPALVGNDDDDDAASAAEWDDSTPAAPATVAHSFKNPSPEVEKEIEEAQKDIKGKVKKDAVRTQILDKHYGNASAGMSSSGRVIKKNAPGQEKVKGAVVTYPQVQANMEKVLEGNDSTAAQVTRGLLKPANPSGLHSAEQANLWLATSKEEHQRRAAAFFIEQADKAIAKFKADNPSRTLPAYILKEVEKGKAHPEYASFLEDYYASIGKDASS